MAYLNKVMAIGNVGKEPKIFHFQNGNMKASFSIATTKRYRDSNGEQKEQTTWIPCVAFGKTAEAVENYVAKGTQVYVEGEFMVSNYTDANGQKKYSTEVKIETIQFLSKFEKSQTSSTNESFNDGDNFDDGELPF